MIIDLSVAVDEHTPVYPGDAKTKIKPAGVFTKDGYNDHIVSIGTHVGTHIDAPLHMLKTGKTINDIAIERFSGRGRYVNAVRGYSLEKLKSAKITKGDIVLFHTGLIKRYHSPAYYHDYPEMPPPIADYLIKKQVKMIGFDSPSPDYPPFPIHRQLLANNILIIENLANLDKLATKRFTVYALPLRLNLDGAPARVIAEFKN
jgi:kynurenine formamidase